ncbi:hypothetical protein J6590_037897 [Homalodisca vitripennis]|nr:hypothetical protein J6590_037897 [Homalodisca vitripennis]
MCLIASIFMPDGNSFWATDHNLILYSPGRPFTFTNSARDFKIDGVTLNSREGQGSSEHEYRAKYEFSKNCLLKLAQRSVHATYLMEVSAPYS